MSTIQLRPVASDLLAALPKWTEREDLKEYFRAWGPLQDWNRPDLIAQQLYLASGVYENDKLVGMVQYFQNDAVARTIAVGALCDRPQCIDARVVIDTCQKLIEDYVFNTLAYRRMTMKVLAHRTGLIKNLQGYGYVIEGRLRLSAKLNGQFVDEIILGFLKE